MRVKIGSGLLLIIIMALLFLKPTVEEAKIACEFSAVEKLGNMRKEISIAGESWPTKIEFNYIVNCIENKGFKFDIENDKCYQVGITHQDIILTKGPECWKRTPRWYKVW